MPRLAADPRSTDALRSVRCVEPHVWDVLTTGRYARAVRLSTAAGPVAVQPAVRDSRGWTRMVRAAESRAVLAARTLAWRRAGAVAAVAAGRVVAPHRRWAPALGRTGLLT